MKISRQQAYDSCRSQEARGQDSGKASSERKSYLNSVFSRVQEMILRIEPKQGMRLLEIGDSPYFTTRAIIHFLKLEPSQYVMINGAAPCATDVRRSHKTYYLPENMSSISSMPRCRLCRSRTAPSIT